MTKPITLYQQLLERGTLEMNSDDYIRLHGWCQRNGAKIKSRKHTDMANPDLSKPWVKVVELVKPASIVKKPSRQDVLAMADRIADLTREVAYWRGIVEVSN